MSLKCFVKVGSVNNLSDARYFSAMNVDLIGFKLDENNNDSITLESLKDLMSLIPLIGVFISFALVYFYPIDREFHKKLIDEINLRKLENV